MPTTLTRSLTRPFARLWSREAPYWPWLLAIFALSLADCVTTIFGLRQGSHEFNLLAVRAFASIGLWPTLVAKEIITLLILTLHAWSLPFWPRAIRALLVIECAGMALIVSHNLLMLL